jgi:methionine--tRNA ligase beta chain
MIFKLETNLGRQHTVSPFGQLYAAYGYSTVNNKPPAAPVEEKKVEELKAPAPKQDQPKKEAKPAEAAVPEKKPKEPKQPKAQPKAPVEEAPKLDEVWEVYSKCDLRVGKILECEPHPDSAHVYREKIDLGEGEPRLIGSGLNGKIPIEEMLSGYVIVFANLKPRKLVDFMSNGMVLCASNEDKSTIELIRPPEGCKIGDRVQLLGNPILGQAVKQAAEEVLNPKKKYAERFLDNLRTNEKCEATYNGVPMCTSEGGVLKSKTLANVHIS